MNTRADLVPDDAADSSRSDVPAAPVRGWESFDNAAAHGDDLSDSRIARMRRQLDQLLAEMLRDDADLADLTHAAGADPGCELCPAVGTPELPGLTLVSAGERGDETESGGGVPDEAFWGPGQAADQKPSGGYQSKHRLAGPPKEPKQSDGRRRQPKHAAPSPSLAARVSASLPRRLAVVRPAGRYATQA